MCLSEQERHTSCRYVFCKCLKRFGNALTGCLCRSSDTTFEINPGCWATKHKNKTRADEHEVQNKVYVAQATNLHWILRKGNAKVNWKRACVLSLRGPNTNSSASSHSATVWHMLWSILLMTVICVWDLLEPNTNETSVPGKDQQRNDTRNDCLLFPSTT